jgi:hypothetical protein
MIKPAMLMNEVLRLVLVLSVSREPYTYIPYTDSILKRSVTWFLDFFGVDPFPIPFYMVPPSHNKNT